MYFWNMIKEQVAQSIMNKALWASLFKLTCCTYHYKGIQIELESQQGFVLGKSCITKLSFEEVNMGIEEIQITWEDGPRNGTCNSDKRI